LGAVLPSVVAVQHLLGVILASRSRHTSFSRDWSSDVCSSDLRRWSYLAPYRSNREMTNAFSRFKKIRGLGLFTAQKEPLTTELRSEERRVGKDGRSRGGGGDGRPRGRPLAGRRGEQFRQERTA